MRSVRGFTHRHTSCDSGASGLFSLRGAKGGGSAYTDGDGIRTHESGHLVPVLALPVVWLTWACCCCRVAQLDVMSIELLCYRRLKAIEEKAVGRRLAKLDTEVGAGTDSLAGDPWATLSVP
jgi:hypothetical protein